MAKKISFDQTSAWIVSVVVTATIFTGGYSLLKRMGNGHTTRQFNVEEMEDPDGEHGKSEHSESSKDDTDSPANTHNDVPAKSDDEASPGHSEHEDEEKHHDDKQEEGRDKLKNTEKVTDQEHKEDHNSIAASDKHSPAKHDVHWSYEGENGPEAWGKLSPQFVDCQDGRSQSPVNLENAKGQRDLRPLKFSYIGIEARLENNGHTLAAKIDPGNFLTFNGSRSGLFNFHFHIPSEHLVGGVPYEMEMHLVHKNEKGNLTVVGLFIEEGDSPNPLLEKIWQELPAKIGKFGPIVSVNLREFLPEDTSYYAYNGSLTTPPCSEAVQWLVVKKSIKASSKQIDAFAHIYRNNARPAQPLYNRKIEKLVSR